MSKEYNFAVYQKPKNEFDISYEEQAKYKKSRLWYGANAPKQVQSDSDDDIFPTANQNKKFDEPKKEEVTTFEQPTTQFQEVTATQPMEVQVNDDDAMLRRRRAIQSRIIQEEQVLESEQFVAPSVQEVKQKQKKEKKAKKEKQKQIVEQQIQQAQEEEEEQEQNHRVELLRPVFVPRREREKLDKQYEEEIRLKEERTRNLERMKLENQVIVLNSVRADAQIKENSDDEAIPNDEDTIDENEYALWKIRELKRLKLYNEEKHKHDLEKKEVERRRNLTDQQRIEEDFKLGSDKTKIDDKAKYVFMQKYYHKGAYFQDSNDPIFQRDYNLPVGEDLWDKSKLPEILQKRRGIFGKRGQSKYTHLTDQDTTDFNPDYQVDPNIRQKFLSKQAGSRQSK